MYTGIVQACLPIESVERKPGLMTFSVALPEALTPGLETGASVAVNGCCFTVTSLNENRVTFDAIKETMELTNISEFEPGSQVNIERSAAADAEIGGHILSGHIIDTAAVSKIENSENNRRLTFSGNPDWLKYVFEKGFLAVNGCSLTVAALDRKNSEFSINLIPETLERTNFSLLREGDAVNIEVESQTQVIVETVERIMAEREAISS